jgi:hypothetical protein
MHELPRHTAGPRLRRRCAIALLSSALTVLSIANAQPINAVASSGAASPLPAPATLLGRFSPVYMGTHWSLTQAQAVTLAQEFDVIAAQASALGKYASVMKAAHPTLRIVAYLNGTFDMSSGGTSYPSTWYEQSSSGARIQSVYGNYLLDPANTSWQQKVAQQCTSAMSSSGYDGCFIDTLGTAPLDAGYCTGLPINPATGAVWTPTDWLAATSGIVAAVQAANPTAVVVAHGLANGTKYFSSTGATSQLLNPTGVAMAELWVRAPAQAATKYRSEAKWLQDVNLLADAESRGQSVLTTTKLWVGATAAQQAAWHKFTLASFLLGTNGHSYFSFLQDTSNTALIQDYTWDHVNVGAPLGAFAKVGGLYQRQFTGGVVAVNPTTAPATITLSGTYTNLDGSVVTSETLAPNTGDVFLAG